MTRHADLQISVSAAMNAELLYAMTNALRWMKPEHVLNLRKFTRDEAQFLDVLKSATALVSFHTPEEFDIIACQAINTFSPAENGSGNADCVYAILEQICFEAGGTWVYGGEPVETDDWQHIGDVTRRVMRALNPSEGAA